MQVRLDVIWAEAAVTVVTGGKKDMGPSIHVHAGLDKQLSIGAAYPRGDPAGGPSSNVVDISAGARVPPSASVHLRGAGHGKSTLQRTLSKPKERRSFLGFSSRAGGASGSGRPAQVVDTTDNELERKQSV